jgi:peptidyl-prolyl cis-trans isomerase SurA
MRLVFCVIMLWATTICASTADQIIAIVGERVITRSELEQQIFLYTTQYEIEDQAQLTRDLLNQMIEGALLVEEAKKETVSVSYREVESELIQVMERMKSGFQSEEEFERTLESEHLTVDRLRDLYREGLREQLLIRKLTDEKIRSKIRVSPLEVQKFYEEYRDSIGVEPERVGLAHILIPITPSPATIQEVDRKMEEVMVKLQTGVDFSEAARTYSDDPSKDGGGYLGYFKRGELVPELEEECFSLNPNEITVMSSELGYHIMLCNDRAEDSVSISQILVSAAPTAGDSARVRRTAEDIRTRAVEGEDFSELARAHSEDPNTKEQGGNLGRISVTDLSPPFSDVADALDPGEISEVVLSPFGYHVIKLVDRVDEREPEFSEVKDDLANFLAQTKLEVEYRKWIDELKQKSYIEIRL